MRFTTVEINVSKKHKGREKKVKIYPLCHKDKYVLSTGRQEERNVHEDYVLDS